MLGLISHCFNQSITIHMEVDETSLPATLHSPLLWNCLGICEHLDHQGVCISKLLLEMEMLNYNEVTHHPSAELYVVCVSLLADVSDEGE